MKLNIYNIRNNYEKNKEKMSLFQFFKNTGLLWCVTTRILYEHRFLSSHDTLLTEREKCPSKGYPFVLLTCKVLLFWQGFPL